MVFKRKTQFSKTNICLIATNITVNVRNLFGLNNNTFCSWKT